MTGEEWSTGVESRLMINALKDRYGKLPVRKSRLFALACCARIDHLLTDPRSRAAVGFATRHVDTPISRQKGRAQVEKAARAARSELYQEMFRFADERSSGCLERSNAAEAAAETMNRDAFFAARYCASFAGFATAWGLMCAAKRPAHGNDLVMEFAAPEFHHQAALLRDIFGNPFRPVAFSPSWLTSAVVGLAEAIYADRAFDRLPILADALQDAGCQDAGVLGHCRGDGPHVRGCWVVDGVLGKE